MQLRAVALAIVSAGVFLVAESGLGLCAEKEIAPTLPKAPTADKSPLGRPDDYKLNMLIRTTLIALNQANATGNYSVLRDLGTPQFQAMNTDARLSEIFAGLRSRNLDLSPVIFFDPKLVREPTMQAGGLLRLTGYVPTEPQRVLFDMGFERVGDQWRLSAIIIDVQPTPSTAAAQPTAKNAPKSGAPAKPSTAKPKP